MDFLIILLDFFKIDGSCWLEYYALFVHELPDVVIEADFGVRVNIDFEVALEFGNLINFDRNWTMMSLSHDLDCPDVHWLYINLRGLLRGDQLNFLPSRDDRIELNLS